MLYTRQSTRAIAEVGEKLEEAAKKRQFGVLTVHNLKETMRKKGVDFEKECRIDLPPQTAISGIMSAATAVLLHEASELTAVANGSRMTGGDLE